MATVQTVVNQVSTDMRTVLQSSGNDANNILTWVDRIHKDVLHSSIYSHLNKAMQTVTLIAGTSNYTLSTTTFRRVNSVIDRTNNRVLQPVDVLGSPAPLGDNSTPAGAAPDQTLAPRIDMETRMQLSRYPEFYQIVGTNAIYIYPTPVAAGTLEVYYENQIVTLASLATTLTVPDDAIDMMVAGTNYLAAQYLKRADEAQMWLQIYEKLKRGESMV